MIINDLRPQGYCGGVTRALKIVKDAIFNDAIEKPLYILGLIIHNKKVKEALEHYGVISFDSSLTRLEMIDQIKEGTAILTAHGVSNQVKEKLNERKIPYLDATCSEIYKLHQQILSHLMSHEVLFIGKDKHPEVEGVMGLSDKITLISTTDDAKSYIKKTSKPIFVANQTTLSVYEIKEIINILEKRFIITYSNSVCMATTLRQKAVIEQSDADLLIVVGDNLSSNTNKLKEVSNRDRKIKAYLIETVEDIDPNWFKDINAINVTSGASTPKKITDEVIAYLKQFNYNKKETWPHVSKLTYLDILS